MAPRASLPGPHRRHAAAVRALAVAGWLGLATACAAWVDGGVSLTSQAMIYLVAVVWVSYRHGRVESAVAAVAAVGLLNFLFVPPRWTLAVEHRDHFIALAAMLGVALLISRLAADVRRESALARHSAERARQLQRLAGELVAADGEAVVLARGREALGRAFGGAPCLVLADAGGEPAGAVADALPREVRDGLRRCIAEAAPLGPGTARWPGLDAWYLPVGDGTRVFGAACVRPAGDAAARGHAEALCALLAQALWRLRESASTRAAQAESERRQLQATLLAAVSHDLRTPLAAIVGAVSSLQAQRDRLDAAGQDRLLASIAAEAAYLATLTENTLQLVRLSDPAPALRLDWESVEEIVGSVVARMRARDSRRRLAVRIAAGLPLVRADPVLLAQLLANLLDNALAYSDGPVELTAARAGDGIGLCVADRGPGIPPHERERLFEPFSRGAASRERAQQGTGLGLAVCRAIAEVHGARLAAEPREGGGSLFRLTLRAEAAPEAATAPARAAPAGAP